MNTLATCDPGRSAGLGWFIDHKLAWCGLNLRPPDTYTVSADRLVIEIPNVHEKRKKKIDPQDLITLAISAGRWIERVPHKALTQQFPAEWKGSVPKELHNGLVLAALDGFELAVFARCMKEQAVPQGKINNVVDAIGLGLTILGRIGRGGRPI